MTNSAKEKGSSFEGSTALSFQVPRLFLFQFENLNTSSWQKRTVESLDFMKRQEPFKVEYRIKIDVYVVPIDLQILVQHSLLWRSISLRYIGITLYFFSIRMKDFIVLVILYGIDR